MTGPVEQQLQAFGQLRGLVFGAWGEAPPDVELLLAHAASAGAHRHWRSMGCGDDGSARGILAWMLRRRWGMTALRENARLKLERLEYVGRGAQAAADRFAFPLPRVLRAPGLRRPLPFHAASAPIAAGPDWS